MKITVLNGSPKGKTSVTMQYVHFVQKAFPQHELNIINIAQRIRKIEKDEQTFQDIIEQIRSSDGVLWAFPLYILHVHAHYKRFIEANTRPLSRRRSTFSITQPTTICKLSVMIWI